MLKIHRCFSMTVKSLNVRQNSSTTQNNLNYYDINNYLFIKLLYLITKTCKFNTSYKTCIIIVKFDLFT